MTSEQILSLLIQASKVISWLGLSGVIAVIIFAKKTTAFLLKIAIAIILVLIILNWASGSLL